MSEMENLSAKFGNSINPSSLSGVNSLFQELAAIENDGGKNRNPVQMLPMKVYPPLRKSACEKRLNTSTSRWYSFDPDRRFLKLNFNHYLL